MKGVIKLILFTSGVLLLLMGILRILTSDVFIMLFLGCVALWLLRKL